MNDSTSGGVIQNTLLLIVSSLLTLIVAEAAFRLFSKVTETDSLEAVRENTARPGEWETVGLGHMVRLSKNPEIIYELIPNISVTHIDVPVVINASGFRGPLIAEKKLPGVKRIVGVGDSVMYGWGVEENEAYLEVLERKLNNGGGRTDRWQVINTAVPGYNTAMELAVLRDKGLLYKPDIVVVGFVENDFALPRFVRQPINYLAIDRSFILDRIMPQQKQHTALQDAPADLQGGFTLDIDMENIPPAYRHMVGLESVRSSLDTLKALSDEYQFEVILLIYRHFPRDLRAAAKSHGFYILNATRLWKKQMKTNDPVSQAGNFQLSAEDPHPSAVGHQVIARGLYDLITTQIITDRSDIN